MGLKINLLRSITIFVAMLSTSLAWAQSEDDLRQLEKDRSFPYIQRDAQEGASVAVTGPEESDRGRIIDPPRLLNAAHFLGAVLFGLPFPEDNRIIDPPPVAQIKKPNNGIIDPPRDQALSTQAPYDDGGVYGYPPDARIKKSESNDSGYGSPEGSSPPIKGVIHLRREITDQDPAPKDPFGEAGEGQRPQFPESEIYAQTEEGDLVSVSTSRIQGILDRFDRLELEIKDGQLLFAGTAIVAIATLASMVPQVRTAMAVAVFASSALMVNAADAGDYCGRYNSEQGFNYFVSELDRETQLSELGICPRLTTKVLALDQGIDALED